MAQCQLKFLSNPDTFADDKSKIVYAGSYLREGAFKWFSPHVNAVTGVIAFNTWRQFADGLAAAFDDPDRVATAERDLKKLKQANKTASAYHAEFVSTVAPLDLDRRSKISAFRDGLSREVKTLLATQVSPPADFDQFVNLVIKLDNNHRSLQQESNHSSHAPSTSQSGHTPSSRGSGSSKPASAPQAPTTSTGTHPGPMDTSNSSRRFQKLTDAEKKRRRDNNLCSYCGGDGHYAGSCPNKRPTPSGSSATTNSESAPPAPPAPSTPAPSASGAVLYSVAAQQPKNSQH
jgi:hypothetical protein